MDIVKYRIEAGLTQKQLADMSGVSVEQIVAIEHKEVSARNVSETVAMRLAYVLGVSVDMLLGAILLDNGNLVYIDEFEWFSEKPND